MNAQIFKQSDNVNSEPEFIEVNEVSDLINIMKNTGHSIVLYDISRFNTECSLLIEIH